MYVVIKLVKEPTRNNVIIAVSGSRGVLFLDRTAS